MEQPNLLQQNQLLNDAIKRRVDQIAAINTVAATVGNSLDLNVTLDTALEAVTTVVGAEAAGISLIDDAAGEVVLRAQLGWLNDFVVDNPMRIPLGQGMSGQVIDNDDVVVHNDLSGDEEYAVPSFRDEHFRSIAMAPMHARGRVIGILSIMSHRPNRFNAELIEVLKSIADTVGVAIENARLYEQHVEQENRLNAILHSTADGIIATDQSSRISLVNQAAAALLNVDAEELLSQRLRQAQISSPLRDKLLEALDPDATENEQFFQVSLDTGHELSVLVSPVQITSQVTGDSNRDGWVIVLQDITYIREAEKARVEFIQAAAHDMKNPLGVTQRSLHMLGDYVTTDDDTAQEIMDIALTGIDRLQQLIDDLLHIEKLESGYDFTLADVNVREMCFEISAQIQSLMTESNIDYDMTIEPDVPPVVQIDRNWMHRAIHNYLENAAKYAPNERVEFRVYCDAHKLKFEVGDTGDGVSKRDQSRLFDRFYRADKDKRQTRGSGLGLAIVKSVAEAHAGDVYLQSTEGEGSAFGIWIPLD